MKWYITDKNPYIKNLLGITDKDRRLIIYHFFGLMVAFFHLSSLVYRLIKGSIWCIWYISLGWLLHEERDTHQTKLEKKACKRCGGNNWRDETHRSQCGRWTAFLKVCRNCGDRKEV